MSAFVVTSCPRSRATRVESARSSAWWCLAAACLAVGLYLNTLNHGYVFDDSIVLTENTLVTRGLAGIPDIFRSSSWAGAGDEEIGYYRPLPLAMFAVEYQASGGRPMVSHAVNVGLYGATAAVALWVLSLVFAGSPQRWFISVAAALLFAAHPAHTEVVANIKSRDEMLSLLGMMLALGFGWRYCLPGGGRFRELALGAACFALAIFSKESAMAYFAVLPLMLWYFAAEVDLRRAALVMSAPAGVAVAYFALKALLLGGIMGPEPDEFITYPLHGQPFFRVVLPTVSRMFLKYLSLGLVPWPLVYDYSYAQFPASAGFGWAETLGAGLFLGLSAAAVFGRRRFREYAFGTALFLSGLAIPLWFSLAKGGIMAERFLYLPSLGLTVVVATGLNEAWSRGAKWPKRAAAAFAAALVLGGAAGTIARNRDWKDNVTLFTADLAKCAENARAHFNLGSECLTMASRKRSDAGQHRYHLERAVAEFRRALEIYPKLAHAYNNLGIAYAGLGRPDDAIVAYERALAGDDSIIYAWMNLGHAYLDKREYRKAADAYRQAVDRGLRSPVLFCNLGFAQLNLGEAGDAARNLETALALDPKYEMPRILLKALREWPAGKERP